jgi:hypothetical protein
MIKIVEDFIIRKKLICYGGTAINNILPERDQFYNKEGEIRITIFFPVTLDDAKELADIYHKAGFKSIEAKSECTSELSRSSLTIFPSPISHRSVLKYTRLFWTTPCLLGNPLLSSRLPSHEYVLELSPLATRVDGRRCRRDYLC